VCARLTNGSPNSRRRSNAPRARTARGCAAPRCAPRTGLHGQFARRASCATMIDRCRVSRADAYSPSCAVLGSSPTELRDGARRTGDLAPGFQAEPPPPRGETGKRGALTRTVELARGDDCRRVLHNRPGCKAGDPARDQLARRSSPRSP
jgi:hypothetical protein